MHPDGAEDQPESCWDFRSDQDNTEALDHQLSEAHPDSVRVLHMRNLRITYFAMFSALGLLPLQVFACSCGHPEPDQYLSRAKLIFKGRVISVDTDGTAGGRKAVGAAAATGRAPESGVRARFKLEKLWKGSASDEVEISYTASNGSNCGLTFNVDQEVTVFASRSSTGGFTTNRCMMIPFDSYTAQSDMRYSDALSVYRATLDSLNQRVLENPSDIAALEERAQFLARYKDFSEAEEAFGRLIAVDPSSVSGIVGRGSIRYEMAEFEGALADFDHALSLQPDHMQARRGHTITLVKLGRMQQLGPKDRDFSAFDSGDDKRYSFAGQDLRGASFKGANLNRVDFSNADLRGADFRGANFHTVTFNGAQLENARFDGLVSGYGSSFNDAALQFASFKKAALSGASFEVASLVKADFEGASLGGASLRGASVRGANFRGASMYGADLAEVDWNGEDLSGADLTGVKLNGAVLRWVSLKGARVGSTDLFGDWRGADFTTADLTDAKWGPILIDCRTKFPSHIKVETLPLLPLWNACEGAPPKTALQAGYKFQGGPKLEKVNAKGSLLAKWDLSGFGFWNIILDGSDLRGANLTNVDIQGGSYDGVRFDGAILNNIKVKNASFHGAIFNGADLSGASLDAVDLSKANLEGAILNNVCFRKDTMWPDGFDAIASGARLCK